MCNFLLSWALPSILLDYKLILLLELRRASHHGRFDEAEGGRYPLGKITNLWLYSFHFIL
ncbi:hypothetical protein KC19_5G151500 [Ceratodon purpureus]|uniref:Uncharacterized protein n=1 Tax=Ceratodon purpureus TaxID=3225 RepID=A0A8T0I351_CERPU|nr:hypothetical protein KC19_5G151500 [Ceratodon purpureus]